MSATDELSKKLDRRLNINEGEEGSVSPSLKVFNPYTEFKEFTRKEIIEFQKKFNKYAGASRICQSRSPNAPGTSNDRYDINRDKFIDIEELKYMMEKLECAQTHLGLKGMIKEVDEDQDGKISFREFLLIFRKAALGQLDKDSGLMELYRNVSEIDVDKEGVKGAKNFFEAKIELVTENEKFKNEIIQEQEERKIKDEEAKERKKQFKEKAAAFNK